MKIDPFVDKEFKDYFARCPIVVYDGGAAGEVYDPFGGLKSGLVKLVGFEPVEQSFNELAQRYDGDANVRLFQFALSDETGQAAFYFHPQAPTTSSLMDRNVMHPRKAVKIEVDCSTLDEFVRRENVPPPDFLKLDTEGSELRILKGGRETVARHVLGIYCEVGFWVPPQSGAQFWEIDAFHWRNGFILFDLQVARSNTEAVGGKKTRLKSGNALYLRDFYTYYDAHLRDRGKEHAKEKLLKMIAICTAFIYLPYALELVDFGREEGLLNAAEVTRLQRHLCAWADIAWRIPTFPGKQSLARVFDFVAYCLHPNAKKSIPPMYNNIGNRPRAMFRQRVPKKLRLQALIRRRRHPDKTTVEIDFH